MDYIRAHRVVSAADLSRALQMTEANARHHLNFLAAQGLIIVIGYRPVQGKGRPVRLFGLSELAIGNQLEGLAKALLTALLQNTTGTAREARLEELACLLIGEDVRDMPGADYQSGSFTPQGTHMAQRLVQAVRRLNEFHYEARWEAHSLGPRLILGRCPYAALIEEHAELCQMDRYVIEHLIVGKAEQIVNRQPDRSGVRHCVFALKKTASTD